MKDATRLKVGAAVVAATLLAGAPRVLEASTQPAAAAASPGAPSSDEAAAMPGATAAGVPSDMPAIAPPAPAAPATATPPGVATAKPLTCPAGAFLDDGACVRLPDDESFGEDPVGAPEGEKAWAGHHEKSGRWVAYEQIPRRPDRPSSYDAYLYPIPPGLPGGRSVVSGYDLDLPDTMQRRGKMRAVGHGGVDLPQRRGTPIRMVPLDHQVGDAEVIHVGPLFGISVVTKHVLREGGRDVEYVLIFGHIDAAAPGLAKGSVLRAGDLVAYVGDTGSPELVHLHLEARRVREGTEASKLVGMRIVAPELTIVCDPRNVLPLRAGPAGGTQ